MNDGFCFIDENPSAKTGLYVSPVADTPSPHYSYLREIDKLPLNAEPEVFGLHPNADIVCEQNATFELFDTLLSLQVCRPFGVGAGVLSQRGRAVAVASRALVDRLVWYTVAWPQPRFAVHSGRTREQLIQEIAESILSKLPAEFDMDVVGKKFEIQYVGECSLLVVASPSESRANVAHCVYPLFGCP